jgi:hypothetical protein
MVRQRASYNASKGRYHNERRASRPTENRISVAQKERRLADLKKADELERLRFSRLINELNEEENKRFAEINAKMHNSGARMKLLTDERKSKIRCLIDGRIRIRKELCRDFPELCNESRLQELFGQLDSMVGNAFSSSLGGPDSRGSSILGTFGHEAKFQLRAHAKSEIEILGREAALRLHQRETTHASVSVTGGNAIVNVGVIYGNVQQVFSKIEQSGYRELAEILRHLATAIEKADSLGDDRAEYLEQVRFIAEQVAEPDEKRQKSVVKGLLFGLQSSLQTVANVAQILSVAGPSLAKHFGFAWPV